MINTPIYNVPSTLIFFDSKIENNIGFIYGLNIPSGTSEDTTISKIAAGIAQNNTLTTKFFTFINSTGNEFDTFMNNYPDRNSYNTETKIYYISKIDTTNNIAVYWNKTKLAWVSNINDATFYFNQEAANENKPIIDGQTTGQVYHKYIVIKKLINNHVPFPCNSFVINQCKDYADWTNDQTNN